MKAAVFEDIGKPIKLYDDIDIIEPRTGEVRVKVSFCSVCHSDLLEIPRLISLWKSQQLELAGMVTRTRPLSEINEAFEDLKSGKGIRTVLTL